MIKVEETSIAHITSPELSQRIEEVRERWQPVTYDDICRQTAAAEVIAPTLNSAGAVILEPETGEIDETQSLVLPLPYQNAWWPHHYVRARVFQQVVAPNSRVIVLPNNSLRKDEQYYDLSTITDEEKYQLEHGSTRPIVERQMRTLEKIDDEQSLGKVGLTGYSFGGRIAIDMASMGVRDIDITAVNVDEMPSKAGRSAATLRNDFLKSGGDIRKVAREADIPALSATMRRDRMIIGMVRFGLSTLTREGKLTHKAITNNIMDRMSWANRHYPDMPIKVGYIAGSRLFSPDYLNERDKPSTFFQQGIRSLHVVQYSGQGLHAHATGDNPFTHALMAHDGLVNTPVKLEDKYHIA